MAHVPPPSHGAEVEEFLHQLRLDSALLTGACCGWSPGTITLSMGFGVVSEPSTGCPGYDNIMIRDKAIGRILKDHGHWTSGFGKNPHEPEVSDEQGRALRPNADRYGLRLFFSFVGGEPNQCQPNYPAPPRRSIRTTIIQP